MADVAAFPDFVFGQNRRFLDHREVAAKDSPASNDSRSKMPGEKSESTFCKSKTHVIT